MSERACRRFARGLLVVLLVFVSTAAAWERQQHRVVVDGHPFAVWSKTPENPRAVIVLVHGRTWSTVPDFDLQVPGETLSLMDGLVAGGIAAYGIDLRGYGATPRDETGWLTPRRAAADVVGVLQWVRSRHQKLTPPYLFGWSYGAMVAQLATQTNGEQVSGLILFGYPVRPGIEKDPQTTEPLRARTTEAAARSDFLLPGSISQAAMDAFVRSALTSDPMRADWRQLKQWGGLDGAAVARPTLLLQAQHDPLALLEVHAQLFASLDTSDKVWALIPDGDHAAFLETPRAYFLGLIERFILRAQ